MPWRGIAQQGSANFLCFGSVLRSVEASWPFTDKPYPLAPVFGGTPEVQIRLALCVVQRLPERSPNAIQPSFLLALSGTQFVGLQLGEYLPGRGLVGRLHSGHIVPAGQAPHRPPATSSTVPVV
jgi:hypothetical protein